MITSGVKKEIHEKKPSSTVKEIPVELSGSGGDQQMEYFLECTRSSVSSAPLEPKITTG